MVSDELKQIISNLNIGDSDLDLDNSDAVANRKASSELTFPSSAAPRPTPRWDSAYPRASPTLLHAYKILIERINEVKGLNVGHVVPVTGPCVKNFATEQKSGLLRLA